MKTITMKRNNKKFNIVFWVTFLLLPWLYYFFGVTSFYKNLIMAVSFYVIMFVPHYLLFKYKPQWFKTYILLEKNKEKEKENDKEENKTIGIFLSIIILLLPWIGYYFNLLSLFNAILVTNIMIGLGLVKEFFRNALKSEKLTG